MYVPNVRFDDKRYIKTYNTDLHMCKFAYTVVWRFD